MYVGIDVGGTKTLIASFDDSGNIDSKSRFPTPKTPDEFYEKLKSELKKLGSISKIAIAYPGDVDTDKNEYRKLGNLPWEPYPIGAKLKDDFGAEVIAENDANLAGLAEANLGNAKEFSSVLYVTISTGIGTGIVVDKKISTAFRRSEGGKMKLLSLTQPNLTPVPTELEDFISGSAIKERYGKYAYEIDDPETWEAITKDLSFGLSAMINLLQPEVLIIGGGVGVHLDKFIQPLKDCLNELKTEYYDLPVIKQAKYPEEAVIYGCYVYAKGN